MDAKTESYTVSDTGHEYLDRSAALRVARDMEDDCNAILDYAEILHDLSSSDFIDDTQQRSLARVAVALKHHHRSIEEMRVKMCHGLHPNAKPAGTHEPV